MKPLEWLGLGIVAILGYFFWKSRTEQTTSPACPAQTQLDGWLSDIATGKMTTDDANKLAQSYANATPPCTDAVSAINAAIAAKGALVVAPHAKTPFIPPAIHKPSIGTGYSTHRLTDAEAAEDVSIFRGDAGFATDDDFLSANAAIATYAPDGGWPPPSFAYRFYPGSPSMRVDTFTSTGRIDTASKLPTYTSSNPAFPGEFVFPAPWSSYTATGVAYEGPAPSTSLSSGGQRMSLARGVWAWDPGMTVNVRAGSAVTKTSGVGFAPAPLLLASEPWR